jgi:membrane protein
MNQTEEDLKPPPPSRPIGQLLRELAADSANLVRQEIALARAEVVQNIRDLGRNVGKVAVGGVIATVGALVFVAFLVIGLGLLFGGMYWLSSLVVALALLVGGVGVAFLGARRLARSPIAPEESLESVRETQRWVGQEVGSLRATLSGNGAGAAAVSLPAGRAEGTVLRVEPRWVDRVGSGSEATGAHRPGSSPALPISEPFHKRLLHEVGDDDVTGQGAKVAFFMFSSLPPAILVLFGLAGIFGGEDLAAFITERMQSVLPGTADDPDSAAGFLSSFVDQVVTQRAPGPLSIGLLLGIWAGSAVFVALTESLNLAFDVPEERSWFHRRAVAIGVMVGFLLLFLGGSVALIAGPQIAGALQLGGAANLAWAILQWPAAFLLVVGAFFLVYLALPNRERPAARWVLLKASAIAAGLWLLATLGFRLYIANFGSYSETYGFVGAILVLLLWMYLTAIVILVGGEIASEMERTA